MSTEARNLVELKSALVVGADASLRRLTSTILRQQGFLVSEAASTAAAEWAFDRSTGSITLLIANFDVSDSEDLMNTVLRFRRDSANLKVVLTSSSSPGQAVLDAIERAEIAFLSLPYSFARFCQAISAPDHEGGNKNCSRDATSDSSFDAGAEVAVITA